MNYKLTNDYFKVVDQYVNYTLYCSLMGIGVLMMILFAVPNVWFLGIVGILLVAIGIALLVCRKMEIRNELEKIPTDEMYDREIARFLSGVQARALNKLGLDPTEIQEIAPLSFSSYTYEGATRHKLGQDGLSRTNRYEVVMLFFLQDEIHCYTYRFFTTIKKQEEITNVYFFQDIVSATTSSKEGQIGDEVFNYEYFELCTSGGTKLTVFLQDVDRAQESINAMRNMLREHKRR